MRFRTTVVLFGVLLALLLVIMLSEPKKQGGSRVDGEGERGLLIRGLASAGAEVTEIRWSLDGGDAISVRRGPEGVGWFLDLNGSVVPCDETKIEEIVLEARMCTISRRIPASEIGQQARTDYGLEPAMRTVELVIDGKREVASLGAAGVMKEVVYASRESGGDVFLVDYGLADLLTSIERDALRRRRILDYRVSEVMGIELIAGEAVRMRASRESARHVWRASVPYSGFLDPIAMDGALLGEILSLEAAEFSMDGASDADLPRFGLAEPRYRLSLRRSGERGGGTQVLAVGADDDAAPGRVFVRVEGRPNIYGCSAARLMRVLGADPNEFRDRNLTRVGGTPLSRISARYKGASFVALSEAGGWRLEEPVRLTLSTDQVEEFLRELRDHEVLEFIDRPDLAALGLAQPVAEIALWSPVEMARELRPDEGRPEERLALRLRFGPRLPDGGAHVLREGYETTAFRIGPALVDWISEGHYQFKRVKIFDADFPKKDPVRLRRSIAGESIVLSEWSSDGWSNGLDAGRVAGVVLRLTGLTAARWVGPVGDRESEYGLAGEGALKLGVWFLDVVDAGSEPLEFGIVVGGKTEGGRFARAVREGKLEPDVFLLDDAFFEVFRQDLK